MYLPHSFMYGIAALSLAISQNAFSADANNVLRVGTSGDYAPFTYKEKGAVTGFDIAVVEAVAKKIGYQVKWEVADFVGLFGQLDSGRIDTVANQLSITLERQQKYQFSQPYEFSGDVFVIKQDNNSIKNIQDLAGKTVGVGFGTADERKLRSLLAGKNVTIKTFDEDPVAELNEVVLGRVDAYYNGAVAVRTAIGRAKLPLKLLGKPAAYDEIGLPFARNARGQALASKVNAALGELKKDGTLQKISLQWLKADVTKKN
ncbi:transporter substrate-binding domain-containing protein [Iodobacter fluviatilis]|uniref:Amino acid ABC transporter substrate-binding protein (PAAT family) n=1 Tax=Iodobacter fluviatilis TaxID=537 RepID=A0A377Q5G8_9NEIS|nr:transporter substrate-binding domain-containing protein [Iodobacter fluviatilis]TCU82665.1 amino acid ABC transporter substrate-binding protein (PAAT family) [Iodobacter fluviatilis]STQ89849.1 Probable amino-acid-binding protein yxeM precursor [Iodobacter fluviatilis]